MHSTVRHSKIENILQRTYPFIVAYGDEKAIKEFLELAKHSDLGDYYEERIKKSRPNWKEVSQLKKQQIENRLKTWKF